MGKSDRGGNAQANAGFVIGGGKPLDAAIAGECFEAQAARWHPAGDEFGSVLGFDQQIEGGAMDLLGKSGRFERPLRGGGEQDGAAGLEAPISETVGGVLG